MKIHLKSPYVLLTLATLFWGANAVVGKIVVHELPPLTITTLRWIVAAFILVPYAYSQEGDRLWQGLTYWKPLVLMGFTGVFAFNTLVYYAVKYTSPINVSLINASGPIVIAVIAFLMTREKLKGIQLLGMLLAMSGVVWVISKGSLQLLFKLQLNWGDLLMLGAIIIWSIYSITVKVAVKHMSSLTATTLSTLIGLAGLIPVSLWEMTLHPVGRITWTSVVGIIYLGVFASVLAFLWWNLGVSLLGVSGAGVFMYLTPVFTVILAYILLGEVSNSSQ
ncbi:MAG: DMT family transporter, partial [Carboxydocellales bacterium]